MPPRRNRAWLWVALLVAIVAGIIALVVALTAGDNVPEPISRAELMAEYARINPIDESATPDKVDDTARTACNLLNQGTTTDALISSVTDVYQSNATAVVRLLVSYGCPQYLKDFK
ncbi:MAG TPA: hypothetical protein VGX25_03270 [Actinophytocola sp.]|uniref:hypothetical protein n=1 Tax=Actinophytocola sp. TaxID=1872138 RepID=UPI002DDCC29A|nr:hypothetical protein [Actinophytocola sp.]HEV2778399.1 hypothetical protein [Actinophytocola sp.]